MLPQWLWSVALHHGEAADPDLLEWIKDLLDYVFNLGPWTVVAVLALIIMLIPISIVVFYLLQQRRHPTHVAGLPAKETHEDRTKEHDI